MVANPLRRAMSQDRRRQGRNREICFAQRDDVAECLFLAGRVHGFSRTLRKGTQLSAHSLDAPRGEVALVFTHVPAADALLAWNKEVATNVLVRSREGARML